MNYSHKVKWKWSKTPQPAWNWSSGFQSHSSAFVSAAAPAVNITDSRLWSEIVFGFPGRKSQETIKTEWTHSNWAKTRPNIMSHRHFRENSGENNEMRAATCSDGSQQTWQILFTRNETIILFLLWVQTAALELQQEVVTSVLFI